MKNIFILFVFVLSSAICSHVYAQQVAPPGAGDKDLADKNIKTRSIDLERVDRDAHKSDNSTTTGSKSASSADPLAAKFAEIKTDYEQIQLSQDVIIKSYQGSSQIDYTQISKSAFEINNSATRLNSNLFPVPVEDANTIKAEKKDEKVVKSIRDLIVELDNTIGSFATSPMFQNLRSVDAKVSEKARLDLKNIIELSKALNSEAQKMAASGK